MKNVQVNTDGLQFDNANGTHTNVNTSATADTYINLPSSSGTLALTSDITPAGPAPLIALQTANEQNQLSSVPVASTYLTVNVTAGVTYLFSAFIHLADYNATAPTWRLLFDAPAASTGAFKLDNAREPLGTTDVSYHGAYDTQIDSIYGAVANDYIAITGTLTAGASGAFVVKYSAQSGLDSIELKAGSWIRLEPVE